MHYQSNALWPKEVFVSSKYGDNISIDTHPTREAADAVCSLLESDGFAGQRTHFPLKTWVSEVQDRPRTLESKAMIEHDYRSENAAQAQLITEQKAAIRSLQAQLEAERKAREEWESRARERGSRALQMASEAKTQRELAEAAERRLAEVEQQGNGAIQILRAINESGILFKHDMVLDAHVAGFLNAIDAARKGG